MLTVKQVSELTGLAPSTVYAAIAKGQLPVHRYGRKAIRLARADVEHFIEAARQGA